MEKYWALKVILPARKLYEIISPMSPSNCDLKKYIVAHQSVHAIYHEVSIIYFTLLSYSHNYGSAFNKLKIIGNVYRPLRFLRP